MPSNIEEDRALQRAIEARNEFASYLKIFSKEKTSLFDKEMREGGSRGMSWRKLFSIRAIFRTIGGVLKNPNHESAQQNRITALTYANYLQHRITQINQIKNKKDAKKAAAFFYQEISIQSEYFKKTDPKGRYIAIIERALKDGHLQPCKKDRRTMSAQEKKFCFSWPLYVAGNHEDGYLKKPQFSAQHACDIYKKLRRDANNEPHADTLFNTIFRKIKGPKRTVDLERPAANRINLHDAARPLGMGICLPAFKYWSDRKMGMVLVPSRMKEFTIQSISADGQVHGKPSKDGNTKPLKDGWYQYIILAEDAPDGSGKKHDMRYFPCVSKPGPEIPNGPPPYSKYIAHSELAGGKRVFAAGAFLIKNGRMILLDDASGHYELKDQNQKQLSLKYAKQKLCQLGFSPHRAEQLELIIRPEMSSAAKRDKYKKKIGATVTGIFSADTPGKATFCEKRPRPPKKLRPAIRSPRDEMVERAYRSLKICSFFSPDKRKSQCADGHKARVNLTVC